MSAIEDMVNNAPPSRDENMVVAIRNLATNKELRMFLTAITRYSKADWSKMVRHVRTLYGVAQSSLLMSSDSSVMNELRKYPHISAFIERVSAE
jgi:hypothetical protein